MRTLLRSALVLATLGGVFAGCASAPETFVLNGTMTIGSNATTYPSPGCHGYKGYDDIDEGTSVTVYDATGKIVGTGALLQGTKTQLGGCQFAFNVPNVPAGQGFYQVEVASRGKVTTDEEKAKAGQLALGLS